MDYRQEIRELREKLNEAARLYYVLDAPTMSDYDYDHLYRREVIRSLGRDWRCRLVLEGV